MDTINFDEMSVYFWNKGKQISSWPNVNHGNAPSINEQVILQDGSKPIGSLYLVTKVIWDGPFIVHLTVVKLD